MLEVITQQITSESPLAKLVGSPEGRHIGFVVRMGYDEVDVVTNDAWRYKVNGLPLNCLLVATAFDPEKFAESPDFDRMVVLLRVMGQSRLPNDDENFRALVEHHQAHTVIQRSDELDGIEAITHDVLQYSGLHCRILGTFFEAKDNVLRFGADAEDFQSLSHLRVYKPTDDALGMIVNYVDPRRAAKAETDAKAMGFLKAPDPFEIGQVRYTSTTRLQSASSPVSVLIHPVDFLARRTAVLGMTRTGKSNTVKTAVGAVQMAAMKAGISVGQIIFDMNGEYANANGQDSGSSIYEVFQDNTVRYRGLQTPGFFDIRHNFFSAIVEGLDILQHNLQEDENNRSQDMVNLINLDLAEPPTTDRSAHNRWEKKVSIYKAILFKAGLKFSATDDNAKFTISVSAVERVFDQCLKAIPGNAKPNQQAKVNFTYDTMGDPNKRLTLSQAATWFERIRETNKTAPIPSSTPGNNWIDEAEKGLMNILVGRSDNDTAIRGARVIRSAIEDYHSVTGGRDIAGEIYAHLVKGRIVIVDLSVGIESVRKSMADKIASRILGASSKIFTEGKAPPQIVIYAEEAHNLIGKDADFDTTWPRIAKEGAKFGVALVYSTQEPSSVHPNILANTENWFVTHLNNDKELKTLSDFYDFEDFSVGLKRAQDVGFARIKTLSAAYVVPTQIKEFKPEELAPAYLSIPRPKGFEPAPTP